MDDSKVKNPARDARDDGGPAFPRPGANWTDMRGNALSSGSSLGISVRDFAALVAMHALIVHYGDRSHIVDEGSRISLHAAAFDHADMFLKERKN